VKFAGLNKGNHAKWECVCECGKKTIVFRGGLRSGTTQSCGCLRDEHTSVRATTHGFTVGLRFKTYKSWQGMIQRCHNPNSTAWKRYGGRGITVCERWRNSFTNFLADMGKKPEGFTIERKDNNLGYSKSNCVWADKWQQANNRRKSRFLTFNGRTQTVIQWEREFGFSTNVMRSRLKNGWSAEMAITRPVQKRRKPEDAVL
jgi:hypothetical protein